MRSRLATASALVALTVAGCAGEPAAPPEAAAPSEQAAGVRIVRTAEAAQLADTSGVTVLDVRTPEEFAEGHLEGAINIDMSAPGASERFAELDRDGSYLLYCRSGNRSAQVRAFLRDQGFSDVADLYGGIIAWEDAGLAVER